MTKELLKKINGTAYKAQLEKLKKVRKHLEESEMKEDARGVYARTTGYIDALRDCGIITERERSALFIYYATM